MILFVIANSEAVVQFYFSGGTPPYTFTYAVNGVNQDPITTNAISYTIYTYEPGIYTLSSFLMIMKVVLFLVVQ